MRFVTFSIVAMGILGAIGSASAQGLTAVRPIPGYICMRIKLTHEQAMDRSFEIPVYSQPSKSSSTIGIASAIVIVKSPLQVKDGLAEILFPDGRNGWLARDLLIPYATADFPNARCTPSIMSNGRPGFG